MPFITEIKTFAALGTGVIGAGWIARAWWCSPPSGWKPRARGWFRA